MELAQSSSDQWVGAHHVQHMLLLIGVLLSAVVILTLLHARSSQGAHGAHLGWMSEQWLAEYRASHPS